MGLRFICKVILVMKKELDCFDINIWEDFNVMDIYDFFFDFV